MNDKKKIECGYELKVTSIGGGSWQLFIDKLDDSSDFVRIIYGITEQVGGSSRTFNVTRKVIISPNPDDNSSFMDQFQKYFMKNRRVWVAFQAVKRVKGKKGIGVGTYIAMSPVQSKWKVTIGSSTKLDIKEIPTKYFDQLYANSKELEQSTYALLEA